MCVGSELVEQEMFRIVVVGWGLWQVFEWRDRCSSLAYRPLQMLWNLLFGDLDLYLAGLVWKRLDRLVVVLQRERAKDRQGFLLPLCCREL